MAASARPRAFLALLALISLTACANVKHIHYDLRPKASTCQVTEVRASGLSTLVSGVCWDSEGKAIGMAGAGGKPTLSVPLDVLQSAAYILGPYLLGQALIKATGNISAPGGIELKGLVDVKSPQVEDALGRIPSRLLP